MVVPEASINNIMGGLESTAGVRLHNHRRKLKQRFDIVRKLGQGTYGKVQLGINKETGQEVAIKTIKKCKIETEADLIRIRREIQIMSSVQHPNIIHIYEVFENREKMVLVMEYAAGGELYDYLSDKKVLTEQEARRIFRQIATAIYYCHKHKICHRDLKLENVLLDEHGSAKIADFGLSNVFDECRLLETFCGSPLYASPEIVKGTPYHGPEVDCWSLGVLLYTLVYGAMPFDGSNFKRLVKQITQGDYFEPKNPSPASTLIRKMLNVYPNRRADIATICSHWWVDEGQSESCLEMAEELANQTPVRLDLLLSLVPPAVSNDKLLIPDQGSSMEGVTAHGGAATSDRPMRSLSLGSLNTTTPLEYVPEVPVASAQYEKEGGPSEGVERKRRKEKSGSKRDRSSSRSRPKHQHDKSRDDSASDVSSAENTTTTKPHRRKSSKSGKAKKVDAEGVASSQVQNDENSGLVSTTPSGDTNKVTSSSAVVDKVLDDKIINDLTSNEIHVSEKKIQEEEKITEKTNDDNISKTVKVDKKEVDMNKINEMQADEVKVEADKCTRDIIEDETVKVAEVESTKTNESDSSESKSIKEAKKKSSKGVGVDEEKPAKPLERRRSKIFETAEKFNSLQQAQSQESKPPPKKVFLPGVKVSDAKRAYERKSSLASSSSLVRLPSSSLSRRNSSAEPSSPGTPPATDFDRKFSLASTVALHKLVEDVEKLSRESEQKSLELETTKETGNAEIVKMSSEKAELPQEREGTETKRNHSLSNAAEKQLPVESKQERKSPSVPKETSVTPSDKSIHNAAKQAVTSGLPDGGDKKAATLPRRKTSRAEIKLATPKLVKSRPEFRSEVEHMVGAATPQSPYQQRAEVVFPVAAVGSERATPPTPPTPAPRALAQPLPVARRSPPNREGSQPREHIIPIRFEEDARPSPPKPPQPTVRRSISRTNSPSLSRQSTQDSDCASVSSQGEPIRKSPREVIIPIAVEGGGYVTPSVDAITRISSLNDSESDLPSRGFGLHSARRPKKQLETADSVSSDEDDDNFEILTAENLFSTLLSRVRNLTHRLNSDDARATCFPRLFNHNSLFDTSPSSRRLSETRSFSRNDVPWRRSMSREMGGASPSTSSLFNSSSSTLPRDLCGRSSLHRLLPQTGGSGSKAVRRRSTASEKPPLCSSSRASKLPWRVSVCGDGPDQQDKSTSHPPSAPPNLTTENIPDLQPVDRATADNECKSNFSSNSDLSDSYKTAKHSRSQSIDKTANDNLKAPNDCDKLARNSLRAANSWSDLSEVSHSSENSKSKSYENQSVKGGRERKSLGESTPSTRSSSSNLNLVPPSISVAETSRLSNSNSSTLSKYSYDNLFSDSTACSTNQIFDKNGKLKRRDVTSCPSTSSHSLASISRYGRSSSYIDSDLYSGSSYLKYPSPSLSRLELSPSRTLGRPLTRRHSTRDSYNSAHALRDRISPDDIEQFRKDFKKGFRGAAIVDSHTNEPKSQQLDTQANPTSQNVVASNTTNEETIVDNTLKEKDELLDGNRPTENTDYVKPAEPTQQSPLTNDSNLPMKVKPKRTTLQRPKSLCIGAMNNVTDSNAALLDYNGTLNSNGSQVSSPTVVNNECDVGSVSNRSRIPNYRRTLSLVDKTRNYNEEYNRQRKYSYSNSTPDRSVLNKFLTNDVNGESVDVKQQASAVNETSHTTSSVHQNKDDKSKGRTRRVSRFLRPDFYDTPLEESLYGKKEPEPKKVDKAPKKLSEKIMSVIKTLRESSHGPKESDIINRESTLIKRAVSLDDVTCASLKNKKPKKRSSSVSYEQHSEAVKTIRKFIQKKKATVKKEKPVTDDSNVVMKDKDRDKEKGGSAISVSNGSVLAKGKVKASVNNKVSGTLNKTEISANHQTELYHLEAVNRPTARAQRIARLERFNLSSLRPDCSATSDELSQLHPHHLLEDGGSSSIVSPTDDNSDSFSTSSDYLDARDFIMSPTPTGEETVSERIRRKSFYSRFNQLRKKSAVGSQPVQHSKSSIIATSTPTVNNNKSRLPTYRRSLTSAPDLVHCNFNNSCGQTANTTSGYINVTNTDTLEPNSEHQ